MTPDPNEHGALKGHSDETSERAAILEYMANMPREEAERLALAWEGNTSSNGASSRPLGCTGSEGETI
jgi:hypothetical protein